MIIPDKKTIRVTKTDFPEIRKYSAYLRRIWKSNVITNHGPLIAELELKLKKYLGVNYLYITSNGTVALEIAIKSLDLKGEIITTPFSYVATTSSIVWSGCKPKFVDIDKGTFNINPALIEKVVNKKTSAILATHVYGNPCDVEKIESLAERHNLRVIYDAAHCFGVNYKNKSILNYGDLSTISFHATKLFHMAEGGAVISQSKRLAHKVSYLRNFGHKGEEDFWGLGINGKNSELHAAIGLSLLGKVKEFIRKRRRISETYDKLLVNSGLKKQILNSHTQYNYSYYPVMFKNEVQMLKVRNQLNTAGIFPRRYFYPPLNHLDYVEKKICSVTEKVSKTILCLPLYPNIPLSQVRRISKIIIENL